MKLPKSFTTVTTLSKILALTLFVSLPFLGFFSGRKYQLNFQDKKVLNTQTNCQPQTKKLEEELEAAINNRLQLLATSEKIYKKGEFAIHSPLFEGKKTTTSSYKYKGENITHKAIKIDDYSIVEIWEYQGLSDLLEIFNKFAVPVGYENYTLRATPVEEIKKDWEESYKNQSGNEMFYDYLYAPKSIGGVSLSSYHDRFSKPSLVRVLHHGIDGFPTSKNESSVLEAKLKLNEIVDALDFSLLVGEQLR